MPLTENLVLILAIGAVFVAFVIQIGQDIALSKQNKERRRRMREIYKKMLGE